jgi:CHAD domain-containing protein
MAASPTATKLLAGLAAEIRRTAESPEPDQVHDLRVAIRRFMQILAILDSSTGDIRGTVKRMMSFAGKVRDCDIAIKLTRKAGASEQFLRRLQRRRGAAERVLILELEKWSALDTPAKWRSKLGPAHPQENMSRALSKAVRRVFKRGAAAEDSEKKLHSLRIAVKKLRYTIDLLDRPSATRTEQIQDLQRRLGDINDYETARKIATQETASKRVVAELRAKQEKKIQSFHTFWEENFADKKREWKRATFQAGAPSRPRSRERQGAA